MVGKDRAEERVEQSLVTIVTKMEVMMVKPVPSPLLCLHLSDLLDLFEGRIVLRSGDCGQGITLTVIWSGTDSLGCYNF